MGKEYVIVLILVIVVVFILSYLFVYNVPEVNKEESNDGFVNKEESNDGFVNYTKKEIKNELSNLTTEKIYLIWKKSSITTEINRLAYDELATRNYWDIGHKINEDEAMKLFNKIIAED